MERACFRMQVDPARIDEYIAAHRQVWPEMLTALESTGWTNYSLFADSAGMIIGYLETEDYEAAQRGMDRTEINAAWQQSMSPYFAAGGSYDEGPERLREVFHLEDQLATAPHRTRTAPPQQ